MNTARQVVDVWDSFFFESLHVFLLCLFKCRLYFFFFFSFINIFIYLVEMTFSLHYFFSACLNRPEHFLLFFLSSYESLSHTDCIWMNTKSRLNLRCINLTFALSLLPQTDLGQVDWPPQVLPAAIKYFPFENSARRRCVTAARPTCTVMLSHQPTFHGPTHDCLSRGLTKALLHISIWD